MRYRPRLHSRLYYRLLRAGFSFGALRSRLHAAQLRDTLAALDINVLLDVGANVGQFARRARAIGYGKRILSFEPCLETFRMLEMNLSSDPEWSGCRYALGQADGVAKLHLDKSSDMSSLLPNPDRPGQHVEQVEVRRLDSVLPELIASEPTPRIFLKTDAQGYDLWVLRGAERCLDLIRGVLMEVTQLPTYLDTPPYHEVLRFLWDNDFHVVDFRPVARSADGRLIEFDVLACRPLT
ncbi:MAG: FkbM family methyltransferase [Thermoanaerobaculia bacterium]|nr:FkbM family methyltransferase [Thermoanaerobaculia bacterium]